MTEELRAESLRRVAADQKSRHAPEPMRVPCPAACQAAIEAWPPDVGETRTLAATTGVTIIANEIMRDLELRQPPAPVPRIPGWLRLPCLPRPRVPAVRLARAIMPAAASAARSLAAHAQHANLLTIARVGVKGGSLFRCLTRAARSGNVSEPGSRTASNGCAASLESRH